MKSELIQLTSAISVHAFVHCCAIPCRAVGWGSQYAGENTASCSKKARLTLSMSRKGEGLDNAPMESVFASLEKKLVHRLRFRTRAQAKAAIFEGIEVVYNCQRSHSGIGYQTSQQAFSNMTWKTAA